MTDAELIEKLSDDEAGRLQTCEQLIADSQLSFVRLGEALREIRDNRYYRVAFTTFEAYCRERWRMGRQNAHQLIAAASVIGNVRNCVQTCPTTESQCRPLTVLEPEQQQQAWRKAIELAGDKQPTAKVVTRAVEEVTSAVTEMERNKIVATLSVEEDMATEDVAKLTGCTEAQVSRVRDEMAEESRETMTFPEAIAKASRRKSITADQLNAWLGKSQKTAEMRKWLSLSKQVSEFRVDPIEGGGQRVRRRPADSDSIYEAFAEMPAKQKLAVVEKLMADPDVRKSRSKKQAAEVRHKGQGSVLQAASWVVEQCEQKIDVYRSQYESNFSWLSKAMKTDEGVAVVMSIIRRLGIIADRAQQSQELLNERTRPDV